MEGTGMLLDRGLFLEEEEEKEEGEGEEEDECWLRRATRLETADTDFPCRSPSGALGDDENEELGEFVWCATVSSRSPHSSPAAGLEGFEGCEVVAVDGEDRLSSASPQFGLSTTTSVLLLVVVFQSDGVVGFVARSGVDLELLGVSFESSKGTSQPQDVLLVSSRSSAVDQSSPPFGLLLPAEEVSLAPQEVSLSLPHELLLLLLLLSFPHESLRLLLPHDELLLEEVVEEESVETTGLFDNARMRLFLSSSVSWR